MGQGETNEGKNPKMWSKLKDILQFNILWLRLQTTGCGNQ